MGMYDNALKQKTDAMEQRTKKAEENGGNSCGTHHFIFESQNYYQVAEVKFSSFSGIGSDGFIDVVSFLCSIVSHIKLKTSHFILLDIENTNKLSPF